MPLSHEAGGTVAAKLSHAGKRVISSRYSHRDFLREFMDLIEPGRLTVELGSGNRRLRDDVINVDMFAFPNVDLVADINATPFASGTVDYAVLDSVMEHVPEPHRLVNELHRVLRPGGRAICIAPFVFPYHGHPRHYQNFSRDGLQFLFREFAACEVHVHTGPTSALTHLLSEYFAVAFSGQGSSLYVFFKGAALLPIFLLKYFDKLWGDADRASRIASHLCAIVTK